MQTAQQPKLPPRHHPHPSPPHPAMIAIEWGTPHHLPICTPSFILVRLHGVAGPPLRCQAIAAGLLGQHRLSCCRRLLRVGLNLLDRYTCTNIVQHGRAQRVSAGPPEYVRLDHVCLACLLSPPPRSTPLLQAGVRTRARSTSCLLRTGCHCPHQATRQSLPLLPRPRRSTCDPTPSVCAHSSPGRSCSPSSCSSRSRTA